MSSSELKSPENKTVFNQDEGDVVQTNRKGAKKGEATKEGSYNLKPVRVYGHPNPNVTTGDSKSVIEVGNRKMQEDVRASNTAGTDTKTCYFYKDRDYNFPGIKIAINPRKYKKFDTLLQELSRKVPGLGFGVRGVFTPRGNDKVSNLDGLTHFGQYVCTDINRRRVRGLDLRAVGPKPKWSTTRPPSGRRILNNLLKEDMDSTESPYTKAKKRYDMSTYYEKLPPKKITVLKNGDPTQRHILLLNRHTGQSYEQILESLCEMFHSPAHKLCTTTGAKVSSLSAMFRGPNTLVCCGKERFVPMDGQKGYLNPGSRVMSRVSLRSDVVSQRMKIRRNRLVNTKGNWKVSVQTNGHSSASTQAQVSITVYGYKGNSGPITLGSGDGTHFQSGNIDEFEINVGNVGEIYKIRISHDNAGDSPGWLCDEVRMKDLDTNEELVFTCRRWLARDEDDGEICREMPAVRKGEPIHSVVRYNVYVTTGNLWNASTDANVYMTMYGDRGDTGVRQLYSSNRSSLFNQGKTDTFTVEAVSLGHLKRIIVGHDGTGPGLGWFLEKIVVKEPNSKAHEENVFYCGKWLDEGEDDGKIVRELKVQDEYMDDILEKRNWEHEKWKFEKNSQVKLYSLASGKAVRGKANGSLDALGGDMDMSALFTVHMKKPMVRMFSSVSNPNAYLTMDNGKMSVNGKGGPFCDFRLRVQGDRSIMFEAVKNPLQFLTFGENGHPEDVRGILDKEKTRRFFVYCKGMFRHRGLIIFCSSMVQTISVNPDLTMTALGKKAKMAQFRVHKVSSGVRMFESLAHPGKYIRMKDGKIDCEGERNEFSHFLVERKKPGGYISLQSSKQRGLYLGMKPDGRVWPTVDTGVNNIYLYPEVLEWGTPKLTEQEIIEEEADEEMFASPRKEKSPEILETKPDTPVKPDSPAQPSVAEGEWGIEVSTQEELQNAKVFIVVYGDKGNSGAIALGGPPGKSIFESGNNDQFKANLLKCGKIYKIRLELEPTSLSLEPIWKVKQVLLTDLAKDDKLTFTFNRWLSRQHEDKEIMRELPAIWENEDPLPLMKYHVMVHTGEEDGSETDATIYLNIYGEKGDTGKRVLLHSNNTQKFRSGQVDLFEVEAVCLGTLQKCVVGHDKLEAGKGWYLTQIVIRESEDAKEEYVFPCNQWLDGGQGDQKIERTLAVKEPAPSLRFYVDDGMPVILVTDPIMEEDEEEDTTFKEGDWHVIIKTGPQEDMSTSNMVFLYAYGNSDSVGPLKLGSGKDGTFKPGGENKVKVSINRDIGDLFKIRLGHNEAYPDSGWYIEKLSLQDCTTGDEFSFNVNRWLSRSHEDGDIWREFGIPFGGKPALPVLTYTLTVYTGTEANSNTTASVFVCLYGKKGDSGKRKLFKSKSTNNPFQVGAQDMFDLEAVSLEGLERITVYHDNKGSDPGWFLEKIVVTDSQDDTPLLFTCNRWLDEKKGDGKYEVDLFPSEESSSSASRGEYSVVVKTFEDSSPAHGGRVSLRVYGQDSKSDDIALYAPDPTIQLFEPGNIDSFTVTVGDLGTLYKIQISREDKDSWEAWHLDEVKLQDVDTKEEYVFKCNSWFSRHKEDYDLVREFPFSTLATKPAPVYHYEVTVRTGNHWAAGTDAILFITLIGEKGDSGRRRLFHSVSAKGDKFTKGKSDVFVLEAVALGNLSELQIGHDSTGHGSGIYIDEILVVEKDGPEPTIQNVFPCNCWLDKREGDGRTWRVLPKIDKLDGKNPTPQRDLKKNTKGQYSVEVKTSDLPNAGTHAQVYITAFGSKGKSKQQPLGEGDPNTTLFDKGTTTELNVDFGDIGDLLKIRLEHDNKNPSPSWHVDWLKFTDVDTAEELVFYINQWLAVDEGDGQTVKEFSVNRPGEMPLPLTQFVVIISTGKNSEPAASHGHVSLNLIGQYGDTGLRYLSQSLLNLTPWNPGAEDVFIIEAVSMGKIEKVQLQFEGNDTVWFVEKIRVYERLAAISQTVFNCHKAFNTKDDGPVITEDFTYSAIKPGICPPKVVEKHFGDISALVSKGRYSMWVHSGSESQGGTEDEVYIVLYGIKGQSKPVHLNEKEKLHPGAIIQLDVDTRDIGAIVKIHIYFGGDFTGTAWSLKKVKLRDQDTREEIHFLYDDLVTCTEENPDGSVELPAVRPDLEPLKDDEFTLYIATNNQTEAGTEADVFCELIGDWGSTGQRPLSKSSNKIPFRHGQVDEFKIKGLDLGSLRECVIGHKEKGRGRGWLCDRVIVKSVLDPALKIFQCGQWMDTGCDDRQLVRHLKLFGEMPVSAQPVTGKSKGKWNCCVMTADKDDLPEQAHDRSPKSREVSLIVYGSESVQGPIQLVSTGGMDTFQPGQTDNFSGLELGNIGVIQKIRICAGYEQDPNTVWTVQKVILTDEDTGEVLTFDFSQWVGEVAGDIRKELPVIKMGSGYKQVIRYYIEIHTSGEEVDAATYSNVFITLYGLMADTGRRHLAASRNNKIKFQTGQIDIFEVEAVNLGDMEKVVVAKGPGNPWLLDKVVVKAGEFNAEQYIFEHNKWIGTRDQQKEEIEETLRLTNVQPSFVAVSDNAGLIDSKGSWKITTKTGGLKGGDNPDLVVVFCSEKEESELCPLKSDKDNPFQVGQTDTCDIKSVASVGELYKLRLGFMDNSKPKGWLLRQITCEDEDTGDIFQYELNDWILVDEKSDGWREIPIPWPAIKVPSVLMYQVIVYTGDVFSGGTDANVYVAIFGSKGSTGRRILKHSLTNNDKFQQDQVDQFEVEAVDLGQLSKVVIGHDSTGAGAGWFLKKVVVTESAESIEKFVFPCNKWLDEGEDDGKIERTLLISQEQGDVSQSSAETKVQSLTPQKPSSPLVDNKFPTSDLKAKTPTPTPRDKTPTPEPKVKTPTPKPKVKTPTPETKVKTPTPEPKVKTPTPEPKLKTPTPEPIHKTPTPELKAKSPTPEPKSKTPEPEIKTPVPTVKTPSPEQTEITTLPDGRNKDEEKEETKAPMDGDYCVNVTTSNQDGGRGTDAQVILTVYGDGGNSGPISLGEPSKGYFKAGVMDQFNIHLDKDLLGDIRKIRLELENTNPSVSWQGEKIVLEDKVTQEKYSFDITKQLSLESGNLAIEIPSDNHANNIWPLRNYVVETHTSNESNAGTSAMVHVALFGTLGDSGRRYLVNSQDEGPMFQAGKVDTFIIEAVDLGRLETVIVGHDGKGDQPGWTLEKVIIKESMESKERYLFPCGSRLQDDDDYGIVEVELYMDRIEREKSDASNQNNNAKEDNSDDPEILQNTESVKDTARSEATTEGKEGDGGGKQGAESEGDNNEKDDKPGDLPEKKESEKNGEDEVDATQPKGITYRKDEDKDEDNQQPTDIDRSEDVKEEKKEGNI